MARRVKTAGFTLVELLVVIGIIAILMAIAFPVFKGAQEKANQTNCISRLHAIGLAVKQYRLDSGTYPSSFADISDTLNLTISGGKLTHGKEKLVCKDDSTLRDTAYTNNNLPYSSYYDISTTEIVWNYYGYKSDGTDSVPATSPFHIYATTGTGTLPSGVPSWRQYPCLENRFAPDYTIITHCTYHRNKTGKNVNQQQEIVLRVDGSAKNLPWKSYDWIAQPS